MAALSGYTKLFNSILASTIWREPNEIRLVWITLLAMADKDGIAEGSVPGIADFARIPVEATRMALERLSQPDEDSRSQEYEGRRIERVPGGWMILNAGKYRDIVSRANAREKTRLRVEKHRANSGCNASVTPCNAPSRSVLPSEAYTDHKQKPSLGNRESDKLSPLHGKVRDYIQKRHERKYKIVCQWDGGEGKILSGLLKANPSWDGETWKRLVDNRYQSEDINGDRPRAWLSNISRWSDGPHDKFGRPKHVAADPPEDYADFKKLGAPKVPVLDVNRG